MRSLTTILMGLCALGLLLPAAAQAQCPNAVTITCGELANGDSTGGTNDLGNYSCVGGSTGADVVYELQLASDATVTAVMTPDGFDATLALLPANCDVDACLDGSDVGFTGGAETVSADLTAGTYYIVADGYYGDSEGPFTLEVTCENCVDNDGDTYDAYDAVNCPSGDDCNDDDANINPGATDTCGDGNDDDCDGFDCPDFCLPAATIACGDVLTGDTTDAAATPNFYNSYGACYGGTSWNGREYVYTLTLGADYGSLSVLVEPDANYDTAIAVLSEAGNGCLNTDCVDAQDGPGSGGAESIQVADITAGTYYIVVDGYGSGASNSGPYQITVLCENCVDNDGDGYNAYDAAECPSGLDCNDDDAAINPDAEDTCEDGIDQDCDGEDAPCCFDLDGDGYDDEACGGTDCDDDDATINPGALEICEDTIDQDCDGNDDTCPACAADASIACDDTGTIDTSSMGANNWTDYCGAGDFGWTGNEYIWSYTAASDGAVLFSTDNVIDIDITVLADYGNGVCNPDVCWSTSWFIGDVNENAGVFAETGDTYYFDVDLYTGEPDGTYDYTMSCLDEACAQDEVVTCGSSISGDTTGGVNSVSLYQGYPPAMMGADLFYAFTFESDATVTVDLLSQDNVGLLVLEDTGNGCEPTNTIGASDSLNYADEQVVFQAAAGATYYIAADGRLDQIVGAFDLDIDCDLGCDPLTQCGYECIDTQTDATNCGGCGTVCTFDNATGVCNAGVCGLGACDANFGDCNGDPVDGCEINHLNNNDYCGDCNTACSGATPYCVAGACTDQCPGNLTNCSGVCVDLQTDVDHCGGCDQACALANVDDQACVAAACEIVACTDGWADCDTNHATGCEVELGTLDNCSGCGDACAYDNASAACTDGACELTACDDGYADCDGDPANGCEVTLGTLDNCTECGDACAYDNASATCTVDGCALDACDANYGDCNGDADTDGCETMLNTSAACGACDVACGPLEGCAGDDVNGYACTATCLDGDGDGFADAECGGPDCNDEDANVNPGADEACNDADDDCDGAIDEGFDADGDGYKACGADADCDDADPNVNPGATEICQDGIDNDCAGGDAECACPDADKDGYQDAACGGADCDDSNVDINPAAAESCNEVDDNCNGQIDEDDVCDNGTNSGCDCSTGGAQRPVASGLLLLALVLGLALPRRRNS